MCGGCVCVVGGWVSACMGCMVWVCLCLFGECVVCMYVCDVNVSGCRYVWRVVMCAVVVAARRSGQWAAPALQNWWHFDAELPRMEPLRCCMCAVDAVHVQLLSVYTCAVGSHACSVLQSHDKYVNAGVLHPQGKMLFPSPPCLSPSCCQLSLYPPTPHAHTHMHTN